MFQARMLPAGDTCPKGQWRTVEPAGSFEPKQMDCDDRRTLQGPLRVAIVDDERSMCRSMSRLLCAAGFRPSIFASAEEFLEGPDRGPFDCILLDVQLGGMSGLELQRRLVESGDRTPVIFLTAHDAPEVRSGAERSGCTGFLRKTELGDAVLAAIRGAAPRRPRH